MLLSLCARYRQLESAVGFCVSDDCAFTSLVCICTIEHTKDGLIRYQEEEGEEAYILSRYPLLHVLQ